MDMHVSYMKHHHRSDKTLDKTTAGALIEINYIMRTLGQLHSRLQFPSSFKSMSKSCIDSEGNSSILASIFLGIVAISSVYSDQWALAR